VHHVRETAATLSRPDVPREVAWAIREKMVPGDSVYVVNYEPIIYMLANAPLPTRYAFPVFLVGFRSVTDTDMVVERTRVLGARPKYIVVNETWRSAPDNWDPQAMVQVEDALARHYTPRAAWTLHASLGVIRLFVLRD
jgi:hypothetical protein